MAVDDPLAFRDRLSERETLERLLHDVRGGRSAVLFTKVGIHSRKELRGALPDAPREPVPA